MLLLVRDYEDYYRSPHRTALTSSVSAPLTTNLLSLLEAAVAILPADVGMC